MLPHIKNMEITDDKGIFHLAIPPELEVFRGHFPNNPILAGVVQLDWVMYLATTYMCCKQRVAKNFKVKFYNIICPNIPLSLHLHLDNDKGRLVFSYHSEGNIMSQGQVNL